MATVDNPQVFNQWIIKLMDHMVKYLVIGIKKLDEFLMHDQLVASISCNTIIVEENNCHFSVPFFESFSNIIFT